MKNLLKILGYSLTLVFAAWGGFSFHYAFAAPNSFGSGYVRNSTTERMTGSVSGGGNYGMVAWKLHPSVDRLWCSFSIRMGTGAADNSSIIKSGTPTDGLQVTLYYGSVGSTTPSGNSSVVYSIDPSAWTSAVATTTLSLSSCQYLTAGQEVWAVLSRTGSVDNSNYWTVPEYNTGAGGSAGKSGDNVIPFRTNAGTWGIGTDGSGAYGMWGAVSFDTTSSSSVSSTPTVTLISPVNATTTASTSVAFQFIYNLPVYVSGDQWAISLTDITAGTSSTVYGSAAPGSNTVAATLNLTTGHLYSWTPVLINAGTSYYGATAVFSVVTSAQIDQYFYTINGGVASSSSDFTGSAGILTTLVNRTIPFSWFIQIYNAWNSLDPTESGSFTGLQLDYHSLGIGSTTPMGNILPDWTAFSSSTVGVYLTPDKLAVFKVLMRIVLYMGAIFYMFRRTKNLIKT